MYICTNALIQHFLVYWYIYTSIHWDIDASTLNTVIHWCVDTLMGQYIDAVIHWWHQHIHILIPHWYIDRLICQYINMSIHWCVHVLTCWYINTFVPQYFNALMCQYIDILIHLCIYISMYRDNPHVNIAMYWCIDESRYYQINILIWNCIEVLMPWDISYQHIDMPIYWYMNTFIHWCIDKSIN